MDQGDRPDQEPGSTEALESSTSAPKSRQSLSKLRRELSEEELASPAVQRLLIEDLERLERQNAELQDYRVNFHERDKRVGVLEEKIKKSLAGEIVFGVMITVGIVNLASCWQSYRMPSYRGYRFPPDIISHAVWLYHRFALSFRDVEDLLARRGVDVTYEAIRKWCRRFGPEYAGRLRRRRGRLGDTWHLDEVFVTIQGRQQYLWRAVDEAGDVLDILVQPRRNRHAAVRFFRKLLKTQRHVPRRLITDKLRSYSAACRTVMPSVLHCTDQYANNRAEVSHQPTRQRERQMRRFKSAAQLQRVASVHGIVQNLFRVGRHLLRSAHHRLLRTRAFVEWDAVTCAC